MGSETRLKAIAEAAARRAGEAQKAGAAARAEATSSVVCKTSVPTPTSGLRVTKVEPVYPPQIATADTIYVRASYVECPHCKEQIEGWTRDPRGMTTNCDFCKKEFRVVTNAILRF